MPTIDPSLAARIRAGTGAPTTVDKILSATGQGVGRVPGVPLPPAGAGGILGLLKTLGKYGIAAGVGEGVYDYAKDAPLLDPARGLISSLGESSGLFPWLASGEDFRQPKDSAAYRNAFGMAPAVPAAPPQRDLAGILAGLGGAGGPGASMSFTAPYFDMAPRAIPAPALPDYAVGAPPAPTFAPEGEMDAILSGIAAGGLDNVKGGSGEVLLAAGLGALGGRAGYGKEKRGKEEQFRKDTAEFEGKSGRQRFSDEAALAEMQRQNEALRLTGVGHQATTLTPKISGNEAVIPQLVTRPDGSQVINYTVRQFPHAALQSRLGLMAALGGGGEAQVPAMFQSLLAIDPSSAIDAAKASGVMALAGQGLSGKTLDEVSQAKILEAVRKNAPQLYAQIQARAQQQWLMKALSGK